MRRLLTKPYSIDFKTVNGTVTLSQPCERVVVLDSSLLYSLCLLKLSHVIIGRSEPLLLGNVQPLWIDDFLTPYYEKCREIDNELGVVPVLGTSQNPDLEKIVDIHPDLVLSRYYNKDHEAFLKSHGIAYLVLDPITLAEVYEDLSSLAKLFGATTDEIDQIQQEEQINKDSWKAQLDLLGDIFDAPQTVFVDLGNFKTIGKDTLLSNLLKLSGFNNLGILKPGKYPQFTLDEVMDCDPFTFISFVKKPTEILQDQSLLKFTTAFKLHRMYYVEKNSLSGIVMLDPWYQMAWTQTILMQMLYPTPVHNISIYDNF